MDIYVHLFYIYVALCVGSDLPTTLFPAQGVLPTVYRLKKLKKAAKVQRAVEPWSEKERKREWLSITGYTEHLSHIICTLYQ
jgi:threonine/homoserine efflux transporter RhtA